MEEIKFIIESQDVLKEEMASIFGGSADAPPVVSIRNQNLNSINPNDIESMQVLKDASSAAI